MMCPEGTLLQPLFQPQAVIQKKAPCPREGLLLSHSVVSSSSPPCGAAESEGCPMKPLCSQGVLEGAHQGSRCHCLQRREPQRVSMSTGPGGQACWSRLVSPWPGDQEGGRGGPPARIRRPDRPALPLWIQEDWRLPDAPLTSHFLLTRSSGSPRGSQEAQLPCAYPQAEVPIRKVCTPSYPLLIPLSITSYT